MKSICIIPARSGSKRIKKKNIKNFFGKPIIYWTIKAAQKSKCFDKIIVSSDEDKILNIAKKYGATKFKRSKKLSNDHVSVHDVIQDVVLELKKKKENYDYICYMFPTSALVKCIDIKKSYNLIKRKKGKFIITVTDFLTPLSQALRLNKKGIVIMKESKKFLKRTQDLEKYYHDAGHIYWANSKQLLKYKNTTNKAIGYYLNQLSVQDINDHIDWKLAEMKFKLINRKNKNVFFK